MGAKRPTLIKALEVHLDGLVEQLRCQENLGWHHLAVGDKRFQAYLRTTTWSQIVTERLESLRPKEEG